MAGCTFDASDSLRFPYAYRHPNGSFVEQVMRAILLEDSPYLLHERPNMNYRHPNGSFVEQGQPWGQPWGQPAAGGGGVCVYPAAAAIGATAISLALPRHLCRNAH